MAENSLPKQPTSWYNTTTKYTPHVRQKGVNGMKNKKLRRLLVLLLTLLLLVVFAGDLVLLDNHDCTGEGCAVCALVAFHRAAVRALAGAAFLSVAVLVLVAALRLTISPCARRTPILLHTKLTI